MIKLVTFIKVLVNIFMENLRNDCRLTDGAYTAQSNAGAVLHHHLHLSVFSDVMICREVI